MHLSNVIFRSSIKLSSMHAALRLIADRVAASVSEDYHQDVYFDPNLVWAPDASRIGLKPSVFTIERRANVPFSENTYFSAAPLGTSEHLALLQEFEDMLAS
jgi:hypothetical protein